MTGPEPTMDELVLALRRALAGMQLYITKTEARSILTAVLPRVLEGAREALGSFNLTPDMVVSGTASTITLRVPIATIQKAASVHSHIDSLLKGETS